MSGGSEVRPPAVSNSSLRSAPATSTVIAQRARHRSTRKRASCAASIAAAPAKVGEAGAESASAATREWRRNNHPPALPFGALRVPDAVIAERGNAPPHDAGVNPKTATVETDSLAGILTPALSEYVVPEMSSM